MKPVLKSQKVQEKKYSRTEKDYCIEEALDYLKELGCKITDKYIGLGNWWVHGKFPPELLQDCSEDEQKEVTLNINILPPKREFWNGEKNALLARHSFGCIEKGKVSVSTTYE